VSDAELRLATEGDLGPIVRLSHGAMPSPPRPGDAAGRRGRIERRLRRALATDPEGMLVLEDQAGLVGFTCAVKREGVWALAGLSVAPDAQSSGHGRRLMRAALDYGSDCHGFLLAASDDERAWRTYFGAGFDLVPTVRARGTVDRARLPPPGDVRQGSADDLERCAEVDRHVRGGGRTLDLESLLAEPDSRLYVTERGYAVAGEDRLLLLAAEQEEDASALLWRVLADVPVGGECWVEWISGDQQWAVGIVLAAGLSPAAGEPYFTRGRLGPLRPWLPHAALL
jgi:GNAT superfamily N-acetyltransferase